MIPRTYWLARKITSSSLSRRQVVDQACAAAVRAIAPTAITTMKMIRMAPDSRAARLLSIIRTLLSGDVDSQCDRSARETPALCLDDHLRLAGFVVSALRGAGG